MDYLVEMRVSGSGRPTSLQEGLEFIEQYVVPSLELCKQMEGEKKIIAGGPLSGTIGLALIVRAQSAEDLDEIIKSLPLWPRMEITVSPLTTFDGRIAAVTDRLVRLKSKLGHQSAA